MAAANATANAAAERAIGNPQTAMLSYRSTTAAKKGGGGVRRDIRRAQRIFTCS